MGCNKVSLFFFYGWTNSVLLASPCIITCSNLLIILVAPSTGLVPPFSASRIVTKTLCIQEVVPIKELCLSGHLAALRQDEHPCLVWRHSRAADLTSFFWIVHEGGLKCLPWNLLYRRYLVLRSVMFWFSRDILQYAEITTQAWYSSWNTHLDHCEKVIPITDLHMPTVRMVDISSSPGRSMWAKALSSLLLSWDLLLLVFLFYTFCGTEPCHIRTSPPAGLASWGRPYMLLIILEEAVCIAWWLTIQLCI